MNQSDAQTESSPQHRKTRLKHFMHAYYQGYQDGLRSRRTLPSVVAVYTDRPHAQGEERDLTNRPAYHAGFREGVKDRNEYVISPTAWAARTHSNIQ